MALINALAAIKTPECIAPLGPFVLDENSSVQWAAIFALSKIRDRKAVQYLQVAAENARNRALRRVAIVAILRLGPVRYQTIYKKALGWLTGEDLKSLVKEHRRSMLGHVQMALDSPRARVRKAGLEALPSLDKAGQKTLLLRLVKDGRMPDMRIAGLRGLVKLTGKKAIASAVALLEDPNRDVRVVAATTLGLLRAKSAAAALTKMLGGDLDKRVQVAVAEALLRL